MENETKPLASAGELPAASSSKANIWNSLVEHRYVRLASSPVVVVPLLLSLVAAILLFRTSWLGLFVPGFHGGLSAHGMIVSDSVDFTQPFFTNHGTIPGPGGTARIEGYNRFPWFFWALMKLVLLIVPNDPATYIIAGTAVMRLFWLGAFAGAMACGYQLLGAVGPAFFAACMGFSGYFIQYYGDMIFNDTPSLCAFFWTMHFILWSRKTLPTVRWYIFAGAASILMGWQPYAVWGTAMLVSWAECLWFRDRERFWWSAFVMVGFAAAIGVGVATLTTQLYQEWSIVGGEFDKLPSIISLRDRTGMGEEFSERHAGSLENDRFLADQFHRIWNMLVPLRITDKYTIYPAMWAGMVALLGSAFLGRRWTEIDGMGFLIFFFAGSAWALPMKNFVVFHPFQSIFWTATAVAIYGMLTLGVRLPGIFWALVGLVVLDYSTLWVAQEKEKAQLAEVPRVEAWTEIFNIIPDGDLVNLAGRTKIYPKVKRGGDYFLRGHAYVDRSKAAWLVTKPTKETHCLELESEFVYLYDEKCLRDIRNKKAADKKKAAKNKKAVEEPK